MSLSFLSPLAALVGLLGVLGLLALRGTVRRSEVVARSLRLRPARGLDVALDAGLLAALAVLVALAASQPVVSAAATVQGREEAEVFAIVDITRSMLAQRTPTSPNRLDRARRVAKELRAGLGDTRVGLASLTDRVLPHLFPTLSANAFTASIDRAVGIERPPPDRRGVRATAIGAIEDIGRGGYFQEDTRRRIAVVLTDGETLPVDYGRLRARLQEAHVSTFFVQVWGGQDAIFDTHGARLGAYRPDPTAGRSLRRIAGALDSIVYVEAELPELIAAVRAQAGIGPLTAQSRELESRQLAPYLLGFAFVPLVALLWRRNA